MKHFAPLTWLWATRVLSFGGGGGGYSAPPPPPAPPAPAPAAVATSASRTLLSKLQPKRTRASTILTGGPATGGTVPRTLGSSYTPAQ